MRREDAIFGHQRHEVGDGAQSRQIEVILHLNLRAPFVARQTQHLEQAMDELEDEASGTERLPSRFRGVVDAGVDQDATGARFLGRVVVHHDDIDAFGLQAIDFGLRVGAAVQGDEQGGLGFGQDAVERGHRKAITLLQSSRHEMRGVSAEPTQEMHQHRGAGNPIDVVVAQDGDALALIDGADDPFGGLAETTDGERVGDVRELRTQVTLRVGLVGEGAGEDVGDGVADSKRDRDTPGKPSIRGPV